MNLDEGSSSVCAWPGSSTVDQLEKILLVTGVPDAHVVAACTYSLVETLEISWIPHGHLTPSFIDGVISSPSAATLRKVEIIYCDGDGICAVDLLRLVQGCPRLKNIWWAHDSPAVRDDPAEEEMAVILWSRGWRWSHDFLGYHDE